MSAARIAARVKPVIVFDSGRQAVAEVVANEETIRRDRVYDAAFRRAGILPVPFLADLVSAAGTLAAAARLSGNRLAVVCNGGTLGRVTMQMWVESGGRPAALSKATLDSLSKALPAGMAGRNPVNLFTNATADRYREAVASVFADEGVDLLFAVVGPTAIGDTLAAVSAITDALPKGYRRKQPAVIWLDQ
ncbi:MAG: GNAT family N-acetyltransferase, partial [Rhodospirillales bacterium]|nr:GNAT family N-acetyltransferase [Rhodospirillales bacterium]